MIANVVGQCLAQTQRLWRYQARAWRPQLLPHLQVSDITLFSLLSRPLSVVSAAVVRQYFRDGHYPCGTARGRGVDIYALQPSAALVKAMIINSAVELTGKSNIYANNINM